MRDYEQMDEFEYDDIDASEAPEKTLEEVLAEEENEDREKKRIKEEEEKILDEIKEEDARNSQNSNAKAVQTMRYIREKNTYVPINSREEEDEYLLELQREYKKYLQIQDEYNAKTESGEQVEEKFRDEAMKAKEEIKLIHQILFTNYQPLIIRLIKIKFKVSDKSALQKRRDEYYDYLSLSFDILRTTLLHYQPTRAKFSTYLWTNLELGLIKAYDHISKRYEDDTPHHRKNQKKIREIVEEIEKDTGKSYSYDENNDFLVQEIYKRAALDESSKMSVKVIKKNLEILKINLLPEIAPYDYDQENYNYDQAATAPDYEQQIATKHMQTKIIEHTKYLNIEERTVLKLYHGLDNLKLPKNPTFINPKTGKAMSFPDIMTYCEGRFDRIADVLDIPLSKVKKIENMALNKMRNVIRNDRDLYNYTREILNTDDIIEGLVYLFPSSKTVDEYMEIADSFNMDEIDMLGEWSGDEEYTKIIIDDDTK